MLTYLLTAVLLILACFLTWLVCPYKVCSKRAADLINLIPGPKPLPFIGNIFHLNVPKTAFANLLLSDHKKYGPNYRFWIFGNPFVNVTDPDDIDLLLRSKTELTKSDWYDTLHCCTGVSFFTGDGEMWHTRKRLFEQAFQANNLRDYFSKFLENSETLVDNLTAHHKEENIDMHKWMSLCTLDNFCDALFGVKIEAQFQKHLDYMDAVRSGNNTATRRLYSPWLYRDLSFNLSSAGRSQAKAIEVVHKLANKVIAAKKVNDAKPKENGYLEGFSGETKKRANLLELMLNYKDETGRLSDEDVMFEVTTFTFVGHDTTAASTCFTLFLLACHPEIQEKVIEEQREVLGYLDRDPDYDELQRLKYLEQVIMESLRLYPTAPIFARKLQQDTQLKNYLLPAGTNVNFYSYVINRNPDIYPDPEKFDPDRFLPENSKARNPSSYVPFSFGPRVCIGRRFAMLELKVMLTAILRKFQVSTPIKQEDLKCLIELVLTPSTPWRVKFTPRG